MRYSLLLIPALAAACNTHEGGEGAAARIQAALKPAGAPLPATLSDTSLFTDGNPAYPSLGVQKYDVKVHLWSDGAAKSRYVFTPSEVKRDPATGKLVFPAGFTLVKHFESDTNPPVPLETRVITLKENGVWTYGTYVYEDDGTAKLNVRPRTVSKGGKDWRVPSEKECKECHTETTPVLGFSPQQLVTPAEELAKARIFTDDDAAAVIATPKLDDPNDPAVPLMTRARTYVHVNCAPCHFPGGPEKANKFDLRLEATATNMVTEQKVVPGDPDGSKMFQQLTASDKRMPNLSIREDPLALELIRALIQNWPADLK